MLPTFSQISSTAAAMCSAVFVVLLVGLFAAKRDIAQAHGLNKIVAMSNFCFAIPLAIFGALHLFGSQFVKGGVPAYMPWPMFWAYFVGCALVAAAISIASKVAVQWSALLFGLMMFSFVAMLHFPGALASHYDRIRWTIVFRESSFGGAALVLAGSAAVAWSERSKMTLITIGRILVAVAAVVFGVEHFLHPTGLPGVPLLRQLPAWLPGRVLIDYVTGAGLVATGLCLLLNWKPRTAATWLGSWIWLLVIVIYIPVMISGLADLNIGAQIEGINYFGDTLLFGAEFLVIAQAMARSDKS